MRYERSNFCSHTMDFQALRDLRNTYTIKGAEAHSAEVGEVKSYPQVKIENER
jgi:hypothetical protein